MTDVAIEDDRAVGRVDACASLRRLRAGSRRHHRRGPTAPSRGRAEIDRPQRGRAREARVPARDLPLARAVARPRTPSTSYRTYVRY